MIINTVNKVGLLGAMATLHAVQYADNYFMLFISAFVFGWMFFQEDDLI